MIPLLSEKKQVDDSLNRESVRRTVRGVIDRLPLPGCVALYGAWGSGKTTLLRAVQASWDAAGRGRSIWFDPWEHEQRGDVISPLMHTIVRRVEESRALDRRRLVSLGARIAKTLASLAVPLAGAYAETVLKIPGAKGLRLQDFINHFDEWKEFHNEIAGIKESFREIVELYLEGIPNGKLVIFLDDLDRCLPDNVVSLLEAIKLLLCGDTEARVLFVFGLDRQIVGEAIAKRYSGSSRYTGESYLEKIFDVSVEVPPVSKAQIDKFLEHPHWPVHQIEMILKAVGGRPAVAEILSDPVFANPRVIKRSLNRLVLLLDDEERNDAVARLLSGSARDATADAGEDRRRFLAWIAGAERFRTFRYAFMESTPEEIKSFHRACRGSGEEVLGKGLRHIAATPGFLGFYDRLIPPSATDEDVDAERRPSGGSGRATLQDFDALLRTYGL